MDPTEQKSKSFSFTTLFSMLDNIYDSIFFLKTKTSIISLIRYCNSAFLTFSRLHSVFAPSHFSLAFTDDDLKISSCIWCDRTFASAFRSTVMVAITVASRVYRNDVVMGRFPLDESDNTATAMRRLSIQWFLFAIEIGSKISSTRQ